jgi:two-component system, sporulation sensor kinase A
MDQAHLPSPLGLREETSRALARSEKELEDIKFALDVSTILAMTDHDGTITWVNDRFCEVSKYSRGELIGQDHRILNSGHHPRAFFRELWATIGRGQVWKGDIKNRAKDGSCYWVATTIVPFIDDQGAPCRYLAIRHEITESKIAEDALAKAHRDLVEANKRILDEQTKLIQAEKLSSIGVLAAGVAHEINNPLSGVLGCIQALRNNRVREDKREEYYATVRDGLVRMQDAVRGLLDYARQQTPAPEVLDPSGIVASALQLVAPAIRRKGVRIENAVTPGASRLRVDRSQLMQAIVNVLLNAIYASADGGRIVIGVARRMDLAGVCITDFGSGIRPEDLKRVCDPFFTTKPEGEGTGLGLAVTLSFARAHGGDLQIESEPGRGTEVTIWLPTGDDPGAAP